MEKNIYLKTFRIFKKENIKECELILVEIIF